MSGLERWEKWDEAELRFLTTYETPALNAYINDHLKNHRFSIGEVVVDKFGHQGVVQKLFEKTGLYVIFPQYEVPQLVRAADMEKVNED
jgi:hypothetical protein